MKIKSVEGVIVTGAAGGIGKAVCERVLREGLGVLAVDNNEKALKKLALDLGKRFPTSLVYPVLGDVGQESLSEATGKAAKASGLTITALVNNAGIYLGKDIFDYELEDMTLVLNTNLMSAIHLTKFWGRIWTKQKTKASIVNLSSISAFEGSSDALYGVSKAGLLGLTKSAAITLAPWVRVNAVAPGIVETPMLKLIPDWRFKEFAESERLKDRITPEAVASAVWFLLSQESRHSTGSVLDITNGGYFR